MRCLLLQAGEGWEELVELHALPVGTLPEDVLQQVRPREPSDRVGLACQAVGARV